MAEIIVSSEERIQILETAILRMMIHDGFELKGSSVHEFKDSARKDGIDPEKAALIYEEIVKRAVDKIFEKKKKQSNPS